MFSNFRSCPFASLFPGFLQSLCQDSPSSYRGFASSAKFLVTDILWSFRFLIKGVHPSISWCNQQKTIWGKMVPWHNAACSVPVCLVEVRFRRPLVHVAMLLRNTAQELKRLTTVQRTVHPLLKFCSMAGINRAGVRSPRLMGATETQGVVSHCGPAQEFRLVDHVRKFGTSSAVMHNEVDPGQHETSAIRAFGEHFRVAYRRLCSARDLFLWQRLPPQQPRACGSSSV